MEISITIKCLINNHRKLLVFIKFIYFQICEIGKYIEMTLSMTYAHPLFSHLKITSF
jgi:hypothetical protein